MSQTQISRMSQTQINLSRFRNMMCLVPDTPEEHARLGRDAICIRTADGDMLLDRARVEAVRSFGNERVYNAGVRLSGQLRVDQPRLASRGITAYWAEGFAHNQNVFYEMLSEDLANKEAATASRLFSVAMEMPGARVARQIVVLGQGHGQDDLLGVSLSELASLEGLHGGSGG